MSSKRIFNDYCKKCEHFYYEWFCAYRSQNCHIHGLIDCNPDSYIKTLKGGTCPDFKPNKEEIERIVDMLAKVPDINPSTKEELEYAFKKIKENK